MKKMTKIILIVIIIIISMIELVNKTEAIEETDGSIKLECEEKIEAGKTITINVSLCDINKNVDTVIATIEYDKDIFEEPVEDDFNPVNNWSYPIYNDENGMFLIEKTGGTTTNETIMSIALKVKENVTAKTTTVSLTDIEAAGLGIDLALNKTSEIQIGKPEEPIEPIEPEEPIDPTEKLYLSSEIYKIGNKDIENFEQGDKYISRVEAETTKETFTSNLKTNGTITIIKEDGTELEENELVGTGMTLKVTKDEENIELKIAVMGDLSGDGKVTATDLSTLNQTVLSIITLENEYKIAADLDENENLTVTDLSTLNMMLLGIL